MRIVMLLPEMALVVGLARALNLSLRGRREPNLTPCPRAAEPAPGACPTSPVPGMPISIFFARAGFRQIWRFSFICVRARRWPLEAAR